VAKTSQMNLEFS